MQYDVIKASNEYDLKLRVNEAIKKGWKPQGGIAFAISGWSETWIQAMVKE